MTTSAGPGNLYYNIYNPLRTAFSIFILHQHPLYVQDMAALNNFSEEMPRLPPAQVVVE